MNLSTVTRLVTSFSRRSLAPLTAAAALLLGSVALAETPDTDTDAAPASCTPDADDSGWSTNLTPVLVFPKGGDRFGGGADPEVKYTLDLGPAWLSAGGRIGAYYAKNRFGVTAMPTLRLTVPVGALEPYAAFGFGYGWVPKDDHADVATMSRLGFVYHFTERFAVGLEGTVQQIEASRFRFPSVGSMVSFDL